MVVPPKCKKKRKTITNEEYLGGFHSKPQITNSKKTSMHSWMLCISRTIFLCLIYFRTICCAAQDFSYKMFTTNDGLSGSQLISVFQDRHGYLWIGTEGGLS